MGTTQTRIQTAKSATDPVLNQQGLTLITLIGVLAVMTVGLAIWLPRMVPAVERHHRETEHHSLQEIRQGIIRYLIHHKAFPPSLIALAPDFLTFAQPQLTQNRSGYPRYYFVHPNMGSFNNATGLTASELPDARILLITNMTRDEAPTITNATEFETWWTTDESSAPGLLIVRENVGNQFHQLTIEQDGNGGSYQVNGTATNSGGGPLPFHNNFHLTGTPLEFDEAASFGSPEVQFGLTTPTVYWFDPKCMAGKQWNPLDPPCGTSGTVRDEFVTVAYTGNDGSQNWSNDWQESGEADGPTAGKIQVISDTHCAVSICLRLGGGGGGPATDLSREVDLSGAGAATLSFRYRRSSGANGGAIRIEVSGDGGGNWTTLQTYSMNGSDPTQVPQSFDLTPYIATNTRIRFVRSGNVKRMFYADHVEVAWN